MVLIVGVAIAAALTLAFAVALVIHFMLLGTDRFNWLEAPKRSDLVVPTNLVAFLLPPAGEGSRRGRPYAAPSR